MRAHYKKVSGGLGNTGLWVRPHIDEHTQSADAYEVSLWEDLDSSAVETHGKYNVRAGHLCFSVAKDNEQALKYCGWKIQPADGNCPHACIVDEQANIVAAENTPEWYYVLADCLWRYGCKDVVSDESGNNFNKLIRQARRNLI